MQNLKYFLLPLALLFLASVVFAAPLYTPLRSVVPEADSTYFIGTTSPSNLRYNGNFNNLIVTGTCTGCGGSSSSFATSSLSAIWPIIYTQSASLAQFSFGGLSTSTAAVVGNIPYFSGVNTFANAATGTISAGTGVSVTAGQSVIGSGLTVTNTGVISGSCSGGTTCSGTNPLTISSFSYPFPSNATSTLLSFLGNASTTQLSAFQKAYFGSTATTTIDSTGNIVVPSGSGFTNTGRSDGCATWASAVLTSTGVACGSGSSAFPFTPTTNYGAAANSTSTALWFQNGLQASSTIFGQFFDTDQYSGYKQAGNLLLYASSTNNSMLVGLGAGPDFVTNAVDVRNTAVGAAALGGATGQTQSDNTAVGYHALTVNSSGAGKKETAIGSGALATQASAGTGEDTALGYNALAVSNAVTTRNTALGSQALVALTTGKRTVAAGWLAGGVSQTSSDSVFLGAEAGGSLTAGNSNIFIGAGVDAPNTTGGNQLNIGNVLYGSNIYGSALGLSSTPVADARIGIGSTTPFARLSVHAQDGDTNKTLFAIGSSTSAAITTLFSISNTGTITTTLGSGAVSSNASGVLSAGTLGVANGGTGAATLTGCLTGNGTGAITGSGTCNTSNATVSSVAASVPSIFSVSGSPITTSGTLAMTYSGTALPVANGGSAATTLTGLLQGNGTSAFTAVTGTAGQFPYYNGTNTLLATSTPFLATNGMVGFGTTTPGYVAGFIAAGYRLSVYSATTFAGIDQAGASGATFTLTHLGAAADQKVFQFINNSGTIAMRTIGDAGLTVPYTFLSMNASNGAITLSPPAAAGVGATYMCLSTANVINSGATCAASSKKVKNNIVIATSSLAKILALIPVSFDYKKGYYGGKSDLGFLAEDVFKVDPRFAILDEKTETLPDGQVIKKGDPMALNLSALLSATVGSVQELNAKVEAQQRIINDLTKRVDALEKKK